MRLECSGVAANAPEAAPYLPLEKPRLWGAVEAPLCVSIPDWSGRCIRGVPLYLCTGPHKPSRGLGSSFGRKLIRAD